MLVTIWKAKVAATLEDSLAVSYQVKHKYTEHTTQHFTPSHLPQGNLKCVYTKVSTWMLAEALFIRAKNGNTPHVDHVTSEWRNKVWPIYSIQYFSAIKSNKLATHATF